MNPLQLLMREHKVILQYLTNLEEMTYSVSVNVRDLSFLIKELLRFIDEHEHKEKLLFQVLKEEGFPIPVEKIESEHGEVGKYKYMFISALESDDDERIKSILHKECGELIDLLKAHILAEEDVFDIINWKKLSQNAIQKIELLEIIADKNLL